MRINDILVEFAPAGGGDSGDYLRALASAWYNGTFDSGSLQKGIKSQQDVERLLNRGIVCPDGKTRKLHIDYNSDFDGVEIYSDDYYNHGDESGELDSRTGQPWGPYDFMAFSDEDLSEGLNEVDRRGFLRGLGAAAVGAGALAAAGNAKASTTDRDDIEIAKLVGFLSQFIMYLKEAIGEQEFKKFENYQRKFYPRLQNNPEMSKSYSAGESEGKKIDNTFRQKMSLIQQEYKFELDPRRVSKASKLEDELKTILKWHWSNFVSLVTKGFNESVEQGVAEGSVFDTDTTGYTKNDMDFINHDINQIKKIRAKLLKIPGFARKVNDDTSQLQLAEKIFNLMKRGHTFDGALVLAQKNPSQQGVAEGYEPPTSAKGSPAYRASLLRKKQERQAAADAKKKQQGVAEGHADQQRKIFKKNGHPVGEVGIDRESSPGNGQWYMKYYATGDDFGGYDSMEEAVADLKHLVNQFKAEGVAEAVWDRPSQSYVPRDGRTFGQTNHPREEHCDACGAATGHAGPGEDSNVDDEGNVYCDDCYADQKGVAEGLPQTLRKVVPGYAKREIDKKMDAGKFGKTDADKDANFQRYKKIQDKLKEQGVAEGSYDNDKGITHTRGSLVAKLEALPKGSDDFEWNRIQAIHHLKQGNMLRAKYYMALMKRGEQGVAEDRLDELSPKTLGSYINKATKDAGTLGYGLGDINARPGKYKDSPDVVKDVKHSFNNRIKGVEKASHRLTKEQGVAEGSVSYTVANDPDKPGMHSYSEVGHAVQSGHSDAAKIYKNNKFLGTVGDVRKQGVAESDDKYAELSKKIQDLAQAGKEGEANKLRYELNRLLMLDRDKKRRQERGVAEAEQQKGADYRDPKEADYGADYQDMVSRVKKLAGLGPLKTQYDPNKRVYRNMPTAVQPRK